jgi:hypothetical protein
VNRLSQDDVREQFSFSGWRLARDYQQVGCSCSPTGIEPHHFLRPVTRRRAEVGIADDYSREYEHCGEARLRIKETMSRAGNRLASGV